MIPFWCACWTAEQIWRNEVEAFREAEAVLVAVVGQGDPPDQLHDEERVPRVGRAGVEDPGDVGVVHDRQRLPLGVEPRQHGPRVHPRPDQLEGHLPPDRPDLLGEVDGAHAPLAELLAELVPVGDRASRAARRGRTGRQAAPAAGRGRPGGDRRPRGQQSVSSRREAGANSAGERRRRPRVRPGGVVEPPPQLRVVAGLAVEEGGPLGGGRADPRTGGRRSRASSRDRMGRTASERAGQAGGDGWPDPNRGHPGAATGRESQRLTSRSAPSIRYDGSTASRQGRAVPVGLVKGCADPSAHDPQVHPPCNSPPPRSCSRRRSGPSPRWRRITRGRSGCSTARTRCRRPTSSRRRAAGRSTRGTPTTPPTPGRCRSGGRSPSRRSGSTGSSSTRAARWSSRRAGWWRWCWPARRRSGRGTRRWS